MAILNGTNANDNITGTATVDTINGKAGKDTLYGGAGLDTIHGNDDNDILVGEQSDLNFVNTPLQYIMNVIPIFSGDTLYADAGNDLVYGDLINLTFKAQAGTDTSVFLMAPLVIQLGSDTIHGGDGNDALIGDVNEILISAQGGTTDMANARAIIGNLSLSTGNDTINGDAGDDTLVGDVSHMTLNGVGGTTNGRFADARIAQNTFTFGDDKLSGGNGKDVLVGDIATLDVIGNGGTASNGGNAVGGVQSRIDNDIDLPNGNTFLFGRDILNGGNGNDTLIGDVKHMSLTASLGMAAEQSFAQGQLFMTAFLFGDDTLEGGEGDDTLIGDVLILNITAQGGIATDLGNAAGFVGGFDFEGTSFGSTFIFGHDTLYGGSQNDNLIGDVQNLTISAQGGAATFGMFASGLFATGQIEGNTFIFGNDILKAESGSDVLVGDVQTLTLSADGGTSSFGGNAIALISSNTFIFGHDLLTGGANNDKLIGDVQNLTISAQGSTSTDEGFSQGGNINNTYIFGQDLIVGELGKDTLIGDVQTLTFSLEAGTPLNSNFAGAFIYNTEITFADDTLVAGNNGSLLIGDVQNVSMNMVGTLSQDIFFQNNHTTFGNDLLVGGAGNDTIYGDTVDMTHLEILESIGSIFLYGGNDILIGGGGDDLLSGGIGDDTLQGGKGNDTIDGGRGIDTVDYFDAPSGVTVNLAITGFQAVGSALGNDKLINVENLFGSAGNDKLNGDANDNILAGYAGNDTLSGKAGRDLLIGGEGNDILIGGEGDDVLMGGAGNDNMNGGEGVDAADYSDAISGVTINLNLTSTQTVGGGVGSDTLSNIEYLLGSSYNDNLIGDSNSNILIGGSGHDILNGGNGNDGLVGGDGIDTAVYNQNNTGNYAFEIYDFTEFFGVISPTEGVDAISADIEFLQLGTTTYTVLPYFFEGFPLDLFGTSGSDLMLDFGPNLLSVAIFYGSLGADIMVAKIPGDGEFDSVVYYGASLAGVQVDLGSRGFQQGGDAEGDQLFGIIAVFGSTFNDTLTGKGMDSFSLLSGGAGDDILSGADSGETDMYGNEGNDTLIGVSNLDFAVYKLSTGNIAITLDAFGNAYNVSDGLGGQDTLLNILNIYGGQGDDVLTGNNWNNHFESGGGSDILDGGEGSDNLVAKGVGSSILIGGAGNDILYANETGNTTMIGGAGNDKFITIFDLTSVTATLSYISSSSAISVNLSANLFLGGDADGDIAVLGHTFGSINIIGSTFDDTLKGYSANHNTYGSGNNVLTGGLGNDLFVFDFSVNEGNDTITDFSAGDTLKFLNVFDNGDHIFNLDDILSQITIGDDGSGHVLATFANGSTIDFINLDYTTQVQLTDVIPVDQIILVDGEGNEGGIVGTNFDDNLIGTDEDDKFFASLGTDTIDGAEGANMLSYIHQPELASPTSTFHIPSIWETTYTDLQTSLGNPSWLPDAPTEFDINGVSMDLGLEPDLTAINTAQYAGNITSFTNITGFQGTNFNDYMVVDQNYLINPDFIPVISGGPGVLLSGDMGKDVLVGSSADDVILAGRNSDFNYVSSGAGNDYIAMGFNLNEGLADDANPAYPFGTAFMGATPNNYFTPGVPIFNLVYAGEGDDIVNSYCSTAGLNLIYLGAGNDTLISICPQCNEIVFAGEGNDILTINCITNVKQLYGEAGNDIFNLQGLSFTDIISGGIGNDIFNLGGGIGGLVEGGADADTFNASGTNVTLSYASSSAGVTVNLLTNAASGGDAAGDNLVNFNAMDANLIGSLFDDILKGENSDNVLTGNAGADMFLFDLAFNEGQDTITDFNTAEDFLQFHNVASVAEVVAQAVITDNGFGHARATFTNGTSVDFTNVNFVVGQTLENIVTIGHVVII